MRQILLHSLGRHVRAQSSVRSQSVSRHHLKGGIGIRGRSENRLFLVQSGHLRDDPPQAKQVSHGVSNARRHIEVSHLSRSKMPNNTDGYETRVSRGYPRN